MLRDGCVSLVFLVVTKFTLHDSFSSTLGFPVLFAYLFVACPGTGA